MGRREHKHTQGHDAAQRDLERWRAQLDELKSNQGVYGQQSKEESERLKVESALIEKELLEVKIATGKDQQGLALKETSVAALEDSMASLFNRQDATLRAFDARIAKI